MFVGDSDDIVHVGIFRQRNFYTVEFDRLMGLGLIGHGELEHLLGGPFFPLGGLEEPAEGGEKGLCRR